MLLLLVLWQPSRVQFFYCVRNWWSYFFFFTGERSAHMVWVDVIQCGFAERLALLLIWIVGY